MQPVEIYMSYLSPPSRAVLMTAKHLHVPHTVRPVDVQRGEHMTADFRKLNPCAAVPVINDNGYILWESRAIQVYLAEKYGKPDCTLYPRDPQKRGHVNRMLFFDMGTLYKAIGDWLLPQIYAGKAPDADKQRHMEEKLAVFEELLASQRHAAGDAVTLADLSLLPHVVMLDIKDYHFNKFPRVADWVARLKHELSYFRETHREFYEWADSLKKVSAAAAGAGAHPHAAVGATPPHPPPEPAPLLN